MQTRRLPWLLAIPVMAAGCLAAHSAAYRLVNPSTSEADHGYLAVAPVLIAIGVASGLVAAVRSVLAGTSWRGAPVYAFSLLPPLAFTLQEHLERALHDGAATLETALEPVFLVGLALQVPFAVGSLAIARTLFRAARAAGALLRRRQPLQRRPSLVDRPVRITCARRPSPLAWPHAGRAPPLVG
jgi:hypothetical protein